MVDSKKYNGSQWEHSLRKLTTVTEAVENPLYSDGTAITSYTIKGNTIQNGTPTPSNPVDVNGVGVMTENLWGGITETNEYINGQGNIVTPQNGDIFDQKGITVTPSSNYTFSWSNFVVGTDNNVPYIRICSYTTNGGTFINRTLITPNVYPDKYATFTIPSNCTYIDIRIDNETSVRGQRFENIMLNTGSTAKPYEPYGYKIPISSGGVTTNIYLGSTQTVRQIKKLVLTGNEDWQLQSINSYNIANFYIRLDFNFDYRNGLCTHFVQQASSISQTTTEGFLINSQLYLYLRISSTSASTKQELSDWLAAQYAAGTPVTVWYVLATPETAAVNEPLMKIGDYADTLSNATAIPTTEGANSITVDTTVQPSEFTATWTGWHNASAKEYDGSDWQ